MYKEDGTSLIQIKQILARETDKHSKDKTMNLLAEKIRRIVMAEVQNYLRENPEAINRILNGTVLEQETDKR